MHRGQLGDQAQDEGQGVQGEGLGVVGVWEGSRRHVSTRVRERRPARVRALPLLLSLSPLSPHLPLPRRPVAGQQEGGHRQDGQELAGARVLDAVVQLSGEEGGGEGDERASGQSGQSGV